MTFWINLIGYQVVWFSLVIGAAHGHVWVAMCVGAVFVASQLLTARNLSADMRLLALALTLGVLIDGVSALTGWLRYASPAPALPPHGAPLWILMLWACFATTINRSLSWLQRSPWLAMGVGAVGAPLAYLAAARGWNTVTFALPSERALAWLALSWGIALGLLTRCARRWTTHAPETST